MLDGFVIEGNVLDQTPLKAVTVKDHVQKKNSLAIFVSIVVHLLLAFLFFFISENQQVKEVKTPKKAIKSYLYKRPAQPTVKQVIREEERAVVLKQENYVQAVMKKAEKQKTTELSKIQTSVTSTTSLSVKSKTEIRKPVQATFSAYKQLDRLRNSINEKIIAQELSERQQFRSPSVMHGEQIPVPHSNKQLTSEQEREKKVTRMSNDISITKYDNGVCTIEREQFLGSPIEGSSSAFACGESKFDKSFREHMKKVQEKWMPVKNK